MRIALVPDTGQGVRVGKCLPSHLSLLLGSRNGHYVQGASDFIQTCSHQELTVVEGAEGESRAARLEPVMANVCGM
jgi:hypothetical protein